MTIAGLQIGEVTARTGLSAKALRLYEAKGLLEPPRSAAGRRIYRDADIMQLQRIMTLKRLGLTLGQIAGVLNEGDVGAARLLGLQLQWVELERERLARLGKTLRASLERVAEGHDFTVDELCSLIKSSEADDEADRFSALLDRWFGPDEQARWKAAAGRNGFKPGPGEDGWDALLSRARQAIAAGMAPDAPAAMDVAVEWVARLKPLAGRMDRTLWNRGATMFRAVANGEEETAASPDTQELYAFIFAAIDAAHRNGLIAEKPVP